MRSGPELAIAFVVLLGAAREAVAGDGSCPPTAVITGDADVVQSLGAALEQLGVSVETAPSCPAVQVNVVRDPAGLRVSIKDTEGRRSQRMISDVETAAAVIDSWIRPDLGVDVESDRPHAPSAAILVADDAETPAALRPLAPDQTRPISVAASVTTCACSPICSACRRTILTRPRWAT